MYKLALRTILLRTALFWAVTQHVVVIPYRHFGKTSRSNLRGSLTLGSGADRLSPNVGKKLPLLAA